MLIQVAEREYKCEDIAYLTFAMACSAVVLGGMLLASDVRGYNIQLSDDGETTLNTNFTILLYFIVSMVHSSTAYIWNTTAVGQVYRNVEAAIKAAPECRMRIECYHYETIVTKEIEKYKDANGEEKEREKTKTERRKVVTHTASEPFRFSLAVDQSPPSSTLHYLDALHLVRLQTYKNISYSPQAMAMFEY